MILLCACMSNPDQKHRVKSKILFFCPLSLFSLFGSLTHLFYLLFYLCIVFLLLSPRFESSPHSNYYFFEIQNESKDLSIWSAMLFPKWDFYCWSHSLKHIFSKLLFLPPQSISWGNLSHFSFNIWWQAEKQYAR